MALRAKTPLIIYLAMIGISFSGGNLAGITVQEVQKKTEAQYTSPKLESATHQGKVISTMDSGGYTYVEFEENGKRLWAASPPFKVVVGDSISFSSALPMTDFHSRTLEKTFETIFFVNQIKVEGAPSAPPQKMELPEGHVPIGEKEINLEPGMVKKAKDGYTIAECFSQRGELQDGEMVSVRGRVVKFTANILNRNWIHIQDGTGDADSRDLTITSQAVVEIGDLILVSGKIRFDKDFGAGYVYPVIIEEASVTVADKEKRRRP